MSGKVIGLLLALALIWWLYSFCGGDPRCPATAYAIRSPIRWLF